MSAVERRWAARARLASLGAVALLGGCQVVESSAPTRPDYRIETSVDAQSEALRQQDPVAPKPAVAPDPVAPDPGAPDPGAPDPGAPDPGAPDPGADPGAPDPVAPDPVAQDPPPPSGLEIDLAQEQEAARGEAAQLRARFGSHILIRPDGRVTKHYFVSTESGAVLRSLLTEPGQPGPPAANTAQQVGGASGSRSMLGRMLGEHVIEVMFVERFERPEAIDIRAAVDQTAVQPQPSRENDLLLVTAKADGLSAFESALDLFLTNLPQIEIEVRVVEYTTTDSLATGVDQLRDKDGDPIAPFLTNLSADKLIAGLTSNFPLVPPLTGAGSSDDAGLVRLGGIHDSWELNAELQLLEARGIADVVSSPRLMVRNGGLASVTLTTDLPYPEARISSSGQNVTANIVFRPVGIELHIRPVLAGTETVILQVFASVSAVTSFANTDPVQTPIIASREALTSVHVTDGKTTVIGGLTSESSFENVTQLPILGDIPILGLLFRSSTEQSSKTTLEFHITPRIIRGPRGLLGS
ncbi:MAG: hypothetical protein AAF628_13530 [Planctomycetota bacterium]